MELFVILFVFGWFVIVLDWVFSGLFVGKVVVGVVDFVNKELFLCIDWFLLWVVVMWMFIFFNIIVCLYVL